MIRASALSFVAILLTSCGSNAMSTRADDESTSGAGGEQGAAFDAMTPEQKGHFMERVVMPAMKPMFQQFDGEKFRGFSCASCHGANAREVHFRMPNTLHPLDPAHMPSAAGDDGRWMRFMQEQVKPKMAELLQREQWTPTNPRGFGCFGCHAMASRGAGATSDDDDDDDDDREGAEHRDHREHGSRGEHDDDD